MIIHRSAGIALAGAALLCALTTSSSAQRERRFAELPSRPVRQNALVDTSSFRPGATRLDFDQLVPGEPVQLQFLAEGVAFDLGAGRAPRAWMDGASPRVLGEAGVALENRRAREHFLGSFGTPSTPDEVRIGFARATNRVGFELRGQEGHMNVFLSTLLGGQTTGRHFFDVEGEFRFVGVESSQPFDELRISFTNPSSGVISLDNLIFELDRRDADRDGIPDFADTCGDFFNPDQADSDGDGLGDACDDFPNDPDNDADGDGLGADQDNCPGVFNPDQADADGDGVGDSCSALLSGADDDGDGVPNATDNCPGTANPDQLDCDGNGVGDVCDGASVTPPFVSLTLPPGGSFTAGFDLCLTSTPAEVDVLILMDTTGSMAGEIQRLREGIINFIAAVRLGTPSNLHFGLASLRDYEGFFPACGYNARFGTVGDYPFRIEANLGSTDVEVILAIEELEAFGGADRPEAYASALRAITRVDTPVAWRPGARRIVVLAGDEIPHDCGVFEGVEGTSAVVSTGQDPGPDAIELSGDEVDWQDEALARLVATNTTVFMLYSGPTPIVLTSWEQWTAQTGGLARQINRNGTVPPGVDPDGTVLGLIGTDTVETVSFRVVEPCDLSITFDPPVLNGPFDLSQGLPLAVSQTVTLPPELPDGVYTCRVQVLGDGAVLTEQFVRVTTGCSGVTFEGLANGAAVSPGDFAGSGVFVSASGLDNYGPAIFDSTPGGPNSVSGDADLLVGMGGILILQENGQQTVPGIFDQPDDAQLGGTLHFDFAAPSELRSIDLIDIDLGAPMQSVTLVATDGAGRSRTYQVPDGWTRDLVADGAPGSRSLDLTLLAPQPGFAATATASEDPGHDPTDIRRLDVHLSSSGALDNLEFCQN